MRNININEKLLLLNSVNKERQDSVKASDRIKTAYQKELSNSRNKKKVNNKQDFTDSNNGLNNNIINEIKDKNKNNMKRGATINSLRTKEKFLKGMKSTKYIEKLKGIQPKKSNNNFANLEEKILIDNININNNTNELNDLNTINDNSLLNKNNKNASNNKINSNLREKLFGDKEQINENAFKYIFNNQEIILKKIQNLENFILNNSNLHKENNIINNEFMSSFNSHKQSFTGINNNSINLPSESPKSNFIKNNS